VFTAFHKPPYTYPYGRSVDETTTVGAADYFYFAVIAEYFIVTGYSFESVRNNTAIHHI
jgi:hypothetical protein